MGEETKSAPAQESPAESKITKTIQSPGFWAKLVVGLGRVAAGIWVKNPKRQKNIGAAIDVADTVVNGITEE